MPYEEVMEDFDDIESPDEGWYDNDLHLAAELGKTLLERNKELEGLLLSTQHQNEDQAMQILYLEKQLQILRDVTESKAHIYEQLDLTSQELEKTNQRLAHELRTSQQRISTMADTIEQLETKILSQQQQVEQLKCAEKERLREGRKQQRILEAFMRFNRAGFQLRRAQSFDLGKPSVETAFEAEFTNLQLSVRSLKRELLTKDQRENELESEVSVLVKENQLLADKVKHLKVKEKLKDLESNHAFTSKSEAVCKYCDRAIHQNGDDDNQIVPTLQAITEEESPGSSLDDLSPKTEGLSILGEIDAQYRAIMEKYNTLLEHSRNAEGSRSRSSSFHKIQDMSVQTSLEKLHPPSELPKLTAKSPVDCHFERSPPEYKKLFKEIFETLQKVKGPSLVRNKKDAEVPTDHSDEGKES